MSDPPSRDTVAVEQVEALLAQLPGVISARLVVNDWGGIEEIHVLATTERHPKQVVRDVESSLAARWGITIDHKKISVAQLTGLHPTLPPVRLRLASLQIQSDTLRGRLQVKVTLCKSDDPEVTYGGQAEGASSRMQSIRVAAIATVEALNEYLDPDYGLTFEDADIINLGGHEVAIVALSLFTPRRKEETLIGATAVKHELLETVVKATLDAVNRRLGRLGARRRKSRPKGEWEDDGGTEISENGDDEEQGLS